MSTPFSSRRSSSKQHPDSKLTERPCLSDGPHAVSSSADSYSPFAWRGKPSEIGAAFIKVSGTGAPAKNHPLRNRKRKLSQDNAFTGAGGQTKPERQPPAVYKKNGLVTPDNNGFCIPPRAQAQADADKRHALRKGGI